MISRARAAGLALLVGMTVAGAAPYEGTMASLKSYEYPAWFRDAKFGIWSHWGPQAVPMIGDWYARRMYEEGGAAYKHHLATYGHPSEFGYKDIVALWKAEKWDPDRLMRLYKRAGARYFVSMAVHHDNFFLWDSKIHRWNSVAMGPRRDVVGEWQKAAQAHGLKFGISEHLGASFTWFQISRGADKSGPKAGVPYDGANPEYQDLYHFPADPDDKDWYTRNPKFHQQWERAILEVVDRYKPDLLYSDGPVVFRNEVGLRMIAHLYNTVPDSVYNCKQVSEGRWVQDLERGIMAGIDPHPWQTDTSIGDWYYNRDWKFRPVSWVIHMLVDNVSKNGNLLLNVVQRPDGSLDPEVEGMLEQLGQWIDVHGEAIYGTRPWHVYGESSVRVKGGAFAEDYRYNAREIRFTTKGEDLYAIALGWPENNELLVKSLATGAGTIHSVGLLGYDGKVEWEQSPKGLRVKLPADRKVSEFSCALKVRGDQLKPVSAPGAEVSANDKGVFVLTAQDAAVHGDKLNVETRDGEENLGFWDNAEDWAGWKLRVDKAGTYRVVVQVATESADAALLLGSDAHSLTAELPRTGGWNQFREITVGKWSAAAPGLVPFRACAPRGREWKAINLRSIRLVPESAQ